MLIGQLAAATGVTTKTLRFYERRQLLRPPDRTSGGYRTYPETTVDRVAFIKRAQAAGLTLRQIGDILAVRDTGHAPCEHVTRHVDDRLTEIDERLRHLHATREHLADLRRRLDTLDPADCTPDGICRAIVEP